MKVEIFINDILMEISEYQEKVSVQTLIDKMKINSLSIKKDNEYIFADEILEEECKINFITINSLEGFRIYESTLIYILTKAFAKLFPNYKLIINHPTSDGNYFEIKNNEESFTEEDTNLLLKKIHEIIKNNLPLEKIKLPVPEAKKLFIDLERKDLLRNIKYLANEEMCLYRCGDYIDYCIYQLAPRTGVISNFDLKFFAPGLILRLPNRNTGKILPEYTPPKKIFKLFQEYSNWLGILKLHNVSKMNKIVEKENILEQIVTEEALQEKKLSNIADDIFRKREIKLVLISGPSSSGKTTFAKRLYMQMKTNGLLPLIISMDDFFVNRDKTPKDENGDYDFESIHALDLSLLSRILQDLLKGKEVEMPRFNFKEGKQEKGDRIIKMQKNNIIIMEGIHALNDVITNSVPFYNKTKVYVSSLCQLNLDYHNRISTTDSRKIRRIVRDIAQRGVKAEDTLLRWESIRKGEDKNIFPFQEDAEYMFNTNLTYEMAVLKKHAYKPLAVIDKNRSIYQEAKRLLEILNHFIDIPDEYVPNNSLLREFIGDSIFSKINI